MIHLLHLSKGPHTELSENERKLSLKSKLLSFSSNFIAGILVLAYAGYKLDEYLQQENHIYLLIGIFLGIIWSMYETFKLVRFINSNTNK